MNTPQSPVYYNHPDPYPLDNEQARAVLAQWAARPGAPQFYVDALAAVSKEKTDERGGIWLFVSRSKGVFADEDDDRPGVKNMYLQELLRLPAGWDDANDILTAHEARRLGIGIVAAASGGSVEMRALWPMITVQDYSPPGSFPMLRVVVRDPVGCEEWERFKIRNCTARDVAEAFELHISDLYDCFETYQTEVERRARDSWLETRHDNAAVAMAKLSELGDWDVDEQINGLEVVDAQLPDGRLVFGVITKGDPACVLRGVTTDRTGNAIQAELENLACADEADQQQRLQGITVTPLSTGASVNAKPVNVDAPRRMRP